MIGPVANSVCIVAGSILGALCGPVLSQEFRKKIIAEESELYGKRN